MNKRLTKKQLAEKQLKTFDDDWEKGLDMTWKEALDEIYKPIIIEAVKAEREACAELRNMFHPIDDNGRQEMIDVMNRGLDEYQAAIRARSKA